jgi:hypothetical protein
VIPAAIGTSVLRDSDRPTPQWRETSLRALATLLAVARKGIVTLLFELALPFAQQAFSDAQRLGYMTKRRTGQTPGLLPRV